MSCSDGPIFPRDASKIRYSSVSAGRLIVIGWAAERCFGRPIRQAVPDKNPVIMALLSLKRDSTRGNVIRYKSEGPLLGGL